MLSGIKPHSHVITHTLFLQESEEEGEESRHDSDDEFLDDGLGQPNGDQDDYDEEIENEMHYNQTYGHYNPTNTCPECGDEIGLTEQMCAYCVRKAFRGAGAPAGMYH